ncbi:MAG: hypothetical protein ABI371_08815 [Gelidibacter sp.]
MKYLLFFLSSICFTSCNLDDKEQFIIDTAVDISIKDNGGNDLLSTDNSISLNQNEFKIFYEINGEKIEVNNGNLDHSKGFFVYQHENEYRVKIFPNSDIKASEPITYIKWNETDIDTLRCEIERNENSEVCKKVWLNDKLVWQAYDTERYFEIIK